MMVPTEIVDHILTFLLSDQDYTALETCSVVFPEIADRHLYSQITFYAPVPKDVPTNAINSKGTYVVDSSKFSLQLIDRPHVAECVRVLRIIITAGAGRLRLPSIARILPQLARLESIAFSASPRQAWPVLDLAFSMSFQNCIRLPSIREVALCNVDGFPLEVFEDCGNLQDLVLYGPCSGGERASASAYPRLCSLGVDSQPDLARIVSWIKNSALHTLTLRMHRHLDFVPFRTLIRECANTLVKIVLDHGYCISHHEYPQHSAHSAFLGLQLPVLEQIVIRCPIIVPHFGDYYSSLPFLAPFLISTPSMVPPGTTIRLSLHIQFHIVISSGLLLDLDWSDVAAFLVLPVFHHPILLYASAINRHDIRREGSTFFPDIVFSFRRDSDIAGLLESGKLLIIEDEG